VITATHVVAWLAIGASASLAGWIWPFRRGALGALLNIALGMAGGIVAPLIVVSVGSSPSSPACLAWAAIGAIAALLLGQLGWRAWVAHVHKSPALASRRLADSHRHRA
jgi:uncharacterized membrane protein YeaQ/YmgE (transglycosylase-associated protein family)